MARASIDFSRDSLVRGVTVVTPLTFRMYWPAAACLSSGLASGSRPRKIVMFRHMLRHVGPRQTLNQGPPRTTLSRDRTLRNDYSEARYEERRTMSDVNDWNIKIIEEFRSHDGQVGGNFEGSPMLLLHTTGAKSGAKRVNPMMYLNLDDHLYVFASKAGADTDPDWFHNLLAHPEVTVELGSDRFNALATPLERSERDRVYAVQAERYPGFGEYQEKTTRVIPVVELVRS